MPDTTKSGLFGPMKRLDSAWVETRQLPRHRLSIAIQHERMKGVTAEMMQWWFENLDAKSTFNGKTFDGPPAPVYRLWHPLDHIRVEWRKKVPNGSSLIGAGSILYVEENMGGKHLSKNSVRLTKLNETAFNFDLGTGGPKFGEVRHLYHATPDGLSMRTEMTFGIETPLLWRFLNPMLQKKAFTPELAQAWILHNVEECGETEKFLPLLYEHGLAAKV